MDKADSTSNEPLVRGKRRQDLQEMLREVGLAVEYWLPKLQEQLSVTCAQALQHIDEEDLQKLKSQAQNPWEKRALEKLLNSNSLSKLQESQVKMMKEQWKKAEQALQELRDLLSQGRQQKEDTVRKKEAELRQAMEISKEYWPPPEKFLREMIENMQGQLNLMEGTLSHRQNFPDRDLVRWASRGLALQGIYKTSSHRSLLEKRQELLSVPKGFLLFAPEHGTQMETREFTSSQEESQFTQMTEKLGFSVIASAKDRSCGFILEAGMDHSKHSESKETKQSHSEHSYFCSTKFSYVPLASCHFPMDQLQFSKAALQELKCIEDLLSQSADPDRCPLLRRKTEAFFQRFGSHANQGPLHLGGIYWWKAISEGFRSEQLAEVKQQSAEALSGYIRGSYSGFGVKVAAGVDGSGSRSETATQSTTFQNFQTKVQLSVAQTGGPPEANGFLQWKAGLVASNQTWSVIDRGLQLVPIWDIILSNHRNDFKDPCQIASLLKDNYTALTGISAQIQDGEELLSVGKEARVFLEDVKSWEVSDPEQHLQKLINFMQTLNQKTNSYDTWVNVCLTDWGLQNFLVNTANFYKNSSVYETKFIKSQLRSLLYPHIYRVNDFPQAHSIMQWVFQLESEEENIINITQFSELITSLKKTQNDLMEAMAKSKSEETVVEAQRKATYKVSLSLSYFLNYLQERKQPDTQLLLLSIAAGAGYHVVKKHFQYLLGCEELDFLVNEMQTAQDKYQELKKNCTYRAQAFLVLTSLTATIRVTAVSPEEKTQRLTLIKHHMGQSLSKEVVHVLSKQGADYDWENLEKDLRLLIDGNDDATISSLQMDEISKNLQSIYNERKQPHKPHENADIKGEIIKDTAFLELLQHLGLEHYYPKKMSRTNFHLINKTSVYNSKPCSESELHQCFLQKLQVLDYELRYLVFRDDGDTHNQVNPSASNEGNEAFNPYKYLFEDSNSPNNPSPSKPRPHIHPMDIQMAIIHCADDWARQYIFSKLSICQFALPLLIPNPCNSQIEFSLWSLSQIRRSWQEARKSPREEKINYKNKQMCQVSTPIVSFIRVGNGFSASKSQIMNCLLSKRKHDVFFHRHCRGSTKDCLLMGGVVEICWFCPGGDDEDRFDNCVTFTNLHGDAKEHKKQLTFLQEVSSLIVVLMSTTDDNKENQKIIRDLSQSPRPLIYLVDNKERNMDNNSSQQVVIGIRNRNEAELTEELVSTIKRLLELSDTVLSLENCAPIARKQGFLIDEDQRDCKEAKEKAEGLMNILRKFNISQMKENLLPLQGHLWHNWCKKDKELYRLREKGNKSIEQHKSEIETEKQRIRRKQLTKAFPLNELMHSVLEILQNNSETQTAHYFLQWMSVFLDNLTAGHLEQLNEKKNILWSQIQTEKQKAPKTTHLQKGIEPISKEISDCTLGIEQLLREFGQIYEALEEIYPTTDTLYRSLPQIAADLMISGAPIELMDGDASYVPVKWVGALFDKVSEKLGNKRLFVLCILGLQSSGKSTLLNALFGLQFTVSAGRCTRGAYMQLLKVEDTYTEELGFDFLLVVDTEGLRAPQLSNKFKNHDNELATFVIGLGNLTLINIFGENPSEMQDILQIVVQAFMRMKQVKISPSCLFIHQNVGEVTAKDQAMEERRLLEQRLDKMATIAAEQEQCSDVTRFGDIIKFDVNTHVYYFAHLWDGNPPMAPPNPRYSHNVQDLKRRILMAAKQESMGIIMKISDVKLRVQDLWRALVNENFIFSFRNTQEVVSMSKLETMYHSWTWQLRSHVLDLQNQLISQIKNGKIQELTASTLQAQVREKYEAIQQELEKYFKEDPDSEIIIQWKGSFENKLIKLTESLIFETEKRAEEHISYKKNQEILDNKMSSYEKELLVKSVELALTLKDKVLSENELHVKFNDLWKNWVSGVSSTVPPVPEPNIEVDAEAILLEHFKKEANMVIRVKEKPGKVFEVNYEEHVKMRKRFGLVTRNLEVHDKESIMRNTDHIISRYTENIKNLQRQQCDYDPSYFHQILNIIEEEVKSEATGDRYTFTNKYKIDLSLYLFQRAYENFKEMHRAFKRANDPVNYLESKKDDFLMGFKISCQGATSIKTFVEFLLEKLTPAVHDMISEKMAPEIAGDMIATCPAFSGNRANLEKHVLISLAEKENFDDYWEYIQNPKFFFNNYIQNHTKIYFSEQNNKIKTFSGEIIHRIKNAILSAIQKSTAQAKNKSSAVSGWLDLFCDHLGNILNFPRKDLVSIEHQEIKDIELLNETMSKSLDELMTVVEKTRFSMPEEDVILEIQNMLSEHLCGCWKQCPFCGAICTNTIPNHDGDHSVPFHRPKAVAGGHWVNRNHFNIDCCTSLVASNYSFVLNGRDIPFKTYRQAGGEFAKWSITPDTSIQPYWKWFVCHFRSNLEEKYKKKFTDKGKIPNAWTRITKQNVLDDLKKQ